MAGSLSRAEQPRAHCPGTVQVAFKASCPETEAALLTAKLVINYPILSVTLCAPDLPVGERTESQPRLSDVGRSRDPKAMTCLEFCWQSKDGPGTPWPGGWCLGAHVPLTSWGPWGSCPDLHVTDTQAAHSSEHSTGSRQ